MSLVEVLGLLQREIAIDTAMRQPGGIRILEERELRQLREVLECVPHLVHTVLATADRLELPLESLTPTDVTQPEL
jgi:hypothetical protein